jgi:hypothetical protein
LPQQRPGNDDRIAVLDRSEQVTVKILSRIEAIEGARPSLSAFEHHGRDFMLQKRLAAVTPCREMTKLGALMSYGVDFADSLLALPSRSDTVTLNGFRGIAHDPSLRFARTYRPPSRQG